MLKKARIRIVAHAIFTYLLFSFTHTLFSSSKIKSCDLCVSQEIRPQTIVQLYLLQDYSSVRISSNMNNKYHTLPIVYTMLV